MNTVGKRELPQGNTYFLRRGGSTVPKQGSPTFMWALARTHTLPVAVSTRSTLAKRYQGRESLKSADFHYLPKLGARFLFSPAQ